MKDIQNSAWNEWANYLLYIVKKHEGDVDAIKKENIELGLLIETLTQSKLDADEFQKFLAEDYVVFKTEVKTTAKRRNMTWGVILGIVTILSFLLRIVLKI